MLTLLLFGGLWNADEITNITVSKKIGCLFFKLILYIF
jgi:hypothetical protein